MIITSSDLVLAARASWLSSVSDDVQLEKIEIANSTCLGYLRSRYTMPLVQVPRDLKKAALDIAIWEIATMKGFNPENPADATFRMRYEDAIKWLKGVGCGSISPDGLLDSSPDYSGSAPEVFSDELRGW